MNNQENIPDPIRSAGKKLPFEVPENYFEDFPERMQAKLDQSSRSDRVIRQIRPALAIAALFIGLITLGYAGFRILTDNGGTDYFTEQELSETIEYFAYELEDDMLAAAVIESDLFLENGTTDPETDELIQYLSEDEIDFSILLNGL